MERRDHIDLAGATALVGFAFLLGFNQIVIKVTNGGFQPVFGAGLRSLGALVVLLIWVYWRRKRVEFPRDTLWSGLLCGLLFAGEFILLFWALDHTTVARASILFYSMPVWLALAAHLFLPGERLTLRRGLGLGAAMIGVAWVLGNPSGEGAGFWGDLAALVAAMLWAGIALTVRLTPVARLPPETQLFWQLSVSAVTMLALAPLFGPLLREVTAIHLAGLVFQIVAVASFGFLLWFFLMKRYPASGVASFSFLSPVISVLLAWVLLGEPIGFAVLGGMVCVAVGLILINRAPRIRAKAP